MMALIAQYSAYLLLLVLFCASIWVWNAVSRLPGPHKDETDRPA